MKKIIKKYFQYFYYFYSHLRYRMFWSLLLAVLVGLMDGLGLAMFIPLLEMVESTSKQIDPQEGFVLSRINGSWDIQSILSICPFREADCLRMIKKLMERGVIKI